MGKIDLKRIINEEITNYQFLGLDDIKEEDSTDAILNSKEFQTRLVHDIINNVVKFKEEYGVIEDIDDNGWGDDVIPRLEKNYSFDYNYNGRPYNLALDLEGRNLPVKSTGQHIPASHLQPAEYPEPESIDYSGVDVMFWDDGTEIKMPWFDKNAQLKDKFVRSIIGELPN